MLRAWSGGPSAPGGDARPPRTNAPPPAPGLPPGMHPLRTLAGTYRPRQLGGPRPEVDHLPRGIHGARCGQRVTRRQPDAWAARVCPRRRLSAFSHRGADPPLARAGSGPALIGSCSRARVPIGRAHEQGPGAVAPGGGCFNSFFSRSVQGVREIAPSSVLCRAPAQGAWAGERAPVNLRG